MVSCWRLGMIGASALGLLAGASPVRAAETEGLRVGRWTLAPGVELSFERDSNLFRRSELGGLPLVSDDAAQWQVGLGAQGALSWGRVEFGVQSSWTDYRTTFAEVLNVKRAAFAIDAPSGAFYRTKVGASLIEGVAETQEFDAGGEAIFRGAAYTLAHLEAEISKQWEGWRAFWSRLQHTRFRFESDVAAGFFDYEQRGLELGAGLGQGALGSLALVAAAARADHFCPSGQADDDRCPQPGAAFRDEERARIGVVFERRVGRRRYEIAPAWETVRFSGTGDVGGDFGGLVGTLAYADDAGGPISGSVRVSRQVFPSFFLGNNFFVSNQLGLLLEYELQGPLSLELEGKLYRNHYGDVVRAPLNPLLDGLRRKDRLAIGRATVIVSLRKRLQVRLWVSREERESKRFPVADYGATIAGTAVSWGWR